MHLEYFIVLAFVLLFPLVRSFAPELKFYYYPKRILLAIGIPFILFVALDIIMVKLYVWWFNPLFITGFKIFNLPVEEILFFIIIPFSSLFLWESLKYLSSKRK